MKKQLFYYTNARLHGKTVYIAGPFLDIADAGKCIDLLGPAFIELEPAAEHATFGVVSVTAYDGPGLFNESLPALGLFPFQPS